jgi:non-specific serine/threonine protein kinase
MVTRQGATFGDVLRRFRLAASLTQEQLAEQAGLSVRGISDLERGLKPRPHRETVVLLANALQLAPADRALLASAVSDGARPRADVTTDDLSESDRTLLLGTQSPDRHNLPFPISSFVGRAREVAEVREHLATTRLLTLVGSGGCGKTRLGLEVARQLIPAFPDGAWLVELAPLSEPELVARAVAAAVGLHEELRPSIESALPAALADRRMLLVLDNCEHLLDACAQLADRLLRDCLGVQILATSREALRIAGEVAWRVPSLQLPPPGVAATLEQLAAVDAVRLFVERARAMQSTFDLTERNRAIVTQICQQLDGMPLAIELAAGRIGSLSPEYIAGRLDQRFRLLTEGSRAALPRQQTLRATVDWSYDLLSGAERALFRHLAVFAGSWTLEAAEAVCSEGLRARDWGLGDDPYLTPLLTSPVGENLHPNSLPAQRAPREGTDHLSPLGEAARRAGEGRPRSTPSTQHPAPSTPIDVLDLVGTLVDKSLVVADLRYAEERFRLIETLRQYGAERLTASGEESRVRALHRDWYLAFVERAEPRLGTDEQLAWLDRIDTEYDDVRQALNWCRADPAGAEPELRFAAALARFWHMRSRGSEGRDWLRHALERSEPTLSPARAKALAWASHLALMQGDVGESRRFGEEAVELARGIEENLLLALTLRNLAGAVRAQGDLASARRLATDALQAAKESGSADEVGYVLGMLGQFALAARDFEEAQRQFAAGLHSARECGDRQVISGLLMVLGGFAREQGRYDEARQRWEEGLAVAEALRYPVYVVFHLVNLAELARIQGDRSEAWRRVVPALITARTYGDDSLLASALRAYVPLRLSRQVDALVVRITSAENAWRSTRAFFNAAEQRQYEEDQATVRGELGQPDLAAAFAAGQRMTLEQAITLALTDCGDE